MQKANQNEFRIEKAIVRKGYKLYVKDTIIRLIGG